jgi:peptide deformylase
MVGAYSMAHPQIESDDPMRFYVTNDRKIIINPVITKHSNYLVDSKEACMTFPKKDRIIVSRWQKLELSFQTIMVDSKDSTKFKLSSVIMESLSGQDSFVAQHEIDHLDGIYIYDKTK